jgi:hypothetical protein
MASAIANCLLKELDHFSKYAFYVADTPSRRGTAMELIEGISMCDAELLRIAIANGDSSQPPSPADG